MAKRKVCVVIASRANYGRVKSVLQHIKNHPDLELQIVAGASALLAKYGKAVNVIEGDGFKIDRKIFYLVEGENLVTQAKSTGFGIIELSTAFEDLKPDIVVSVADRFETMATAIAASYMNIPLAHIQGGEWTGNIDNDVRHAITKLSHLHFPATQQSAERIKRMGEEEWRVHCTGCPAMDILGLSNFDLDQNMFSKEGTGNPPDVNKPYILVIQHPVTSSYGSGGQQMSSVLKGVKDLPIQKVVLWPNADAGSDDVAKSIRVFREKNKPEDFYFRINFKPEDFAKVLKNAACVVGNSSSFIREGAFLGVPAVMVGDRQEEREHGKNVVFASYDEKEVSEKILQQLEHGPYSPDHIFGDGKAGERIANILSTTSLDTRKKKVY